MQAMHRMECRCANAISRSSPVATQMFLDTIQQFDWALFLRCSRKFQKLRVRPTRGIALPVGLPGSNPHSVMGGRPKSTRE